MTRRDGATGQGGAGTFLCFSADRLGCHQDGAVLVAMHNDLQENFAASWRPGSGANVANDEQIRLEVFSRQAALSLGTPRRNARAPAPTLSGRRTEPALMALIPMA